MTDTIRIKRRAAGGSAGPPASLSASELAYNEQDDTLWYGKGNSAGAATSIVKAGGVGNFLPLTGGTLTGNLQVNAKITTSYADVTLDGSPTTFQTAADGSANWLGTHIAIGANSQSAAIVLAKTRNTTPSTFTNIALGDQLGQIWTYGAVGGAYKPSAVFGVKVDSTGTINTNPPGYFYVSTSPGNANPTEQFSINSGGAATFLGTMVSKGFADGSNAAAGNVGEYAEAVFSPAINISSATVWNIGTLALTAGDWDITGTAIFAPAATTTVNYCIACISGASATLDTNVGRYAGIPIFGNTPGSQMSTFTLVIGPTRLTVSTSFTMYLVVMCGFAVSTFGVTGNLRARRIR